MINASQVVVTTSWDDGHPLDLKLASLLSDFGIKGTFYVSTRNRERPVMGARDLRHLSQRFEIGAHSITHAKLASLCDRELLKEIAGSKIELESVLGKPVPMFCYPSGKHNKRVRQAVAKAGFIAARTTAEFSVDCGKDRFQMPTTIQAFPHPPWIRIRHGVKTGNWHGLRELLRIGPKKSWVQLACAFFERALTNGGVWHLWGHSWEIEEHHLWDDLRVVLDTVAHGEGASYLTNGQVIQEVAKLQSGKQPYQMKLLYK